VSNNQGMHQLLAPSLPLGANSHRPLLDEWVTTFVVGPDGEVFQKDLGPDTARIAAGMTTFDPDLSWAHIALIND
jgi:hypothetical protein